MSVSSHLTPEPERRLWLILEDAARASDRQDWKLAALTALCAAQSLAAGPSVWMTAAALVGLAGVSPLSASPRLRRLDQPGTHGSVNDCLVDPADLVGYSRAELVLKLDRYLGGGVTATQYYEDLVGRILSSARLSRRKTIFLAVQCGLAAAGQLALYLRL